MPPERASPPSLPTGVGRARYAAAMTLLVAWRDRVDEWTNRVSPPTEAEVDELSADMETAARLVRGMIREGRERG